MALTVALLQVIAVVATIVTVYFARQTVDESRRLRREYEHERSLQRLERAAELVELINAYFVRGSYPEAIEAQASLRIVVSPLREAAPLTWKICERDLSKVDLIAIAEIEFARGELEKARLNEIAAAPLPVGRSGFRVAPVRLAAGICVVAVAFSAAVYIHQRHTWTKAVPAFTPTGYGSAYRARPAIPSRGQHPSWEDPAAVLLAIGGIGLAVGVVRFRAH